MRLQLQADTQTMLCSVLQVYMCWRKNNKNKTKNVGKIKKNVKNVKKT